MRGSGCRKMRAIRQAVRQRRRDALSRTRRLPGWRPRLALRRREPTRRPPFSAEIGHKAELPPPHGRAARRLPAGRRRRRRTPASRRAVGRAGSLGVADFARGGRAAGAEGRVVQFRLASSRAASANCAQVGVAATSVGQGVQLLLPAFAGTLQRKPSSRHSAAARECVHDLRFSDAIAASWLLLRGHGDPAGPHLAGADLLLVRRPTRRRRSADWDVARSPSGKRRR